MKSQPANASRGACAPLGLVVLVTLGCVAPEPPVLSPVVDVEEAKPYRVEAEGEVVIGGRGVPGTVRADYVVQPGGGIRFLALAAWMDDTDLEITFAGWEVEREPVRCASIQNTRPIKGTVEGGAFSIAPGDAEVVGFWFEKRGEDGECRGGRRHFTIDNGQVITGVHDPAGDHFAISFDFTAEFDGQELDFAMAAEGSYLNRPPVGSIASGPPDQAVAALVEGCPGSEKGEPPVALANGPDGLTWRWRSLSRDPDGEPFAGAGGGKFPRTDIAFEQWAHAAGDDAYRHLGAGPTLAPMLFGNGREHRLLLTVTDHTGARDNVLCHFQVREEP